MVIYCRNISSIHNSPEYGFLRTVLHILLMNASTDMPWISSITYLVTDYTSIRRCVSMCSSKFKSETRLGSASNTHSPHKPDLLFAIFVIRISILLGHIEIRWSQDSNSSSSKSSHQSISLTSTPHIDPTRKAALQNLTVVNSSFPWLMTKAQPQCFCLFLIGSCRRLSSQYSSGMLARRFTAL